MRPVVGDRAVAPGGIPQGRLHLDDVRPVVGEQLGAVAPGYPVREVEDVQVGQCRLPLANHSGVYGRAGRGKREGGIELVILTAAKNLSCPSLRTRRTERPFASLRVTG